MRLAAVILLIYRGTLPPPATALHRARIIINVDDVSREPFASRAYGEDNPLARIDRGDRNALGRAFYGLIPPTQICSGVFVAEETARAIEINTTKPKHSIDYNRPALLTMCSIEPRSVMLHYCYL